MANRKERVELHLRLLALVWAYLKQGLPYIAQDGLELLLPQSPGSCELQAHPIGMAYSQNLNINNYYLSIPVLEFTYHCNLKYVNCTTSLIFYHFLKEIIRTLEPFIYTDVQCCINRKYLRQTKGNLD